MGSGVHIRPGSETAVRRLMKWRDGGREIDLRGRASLQVWNRVTAGEIAAIYSKKESLHSLSSLKTKFVSYSFSSGEGVGNSPPPYSLDSW